MLREAIEHIFLQEILVISLSVVWGTLLLPTNESSSSSSSWFVAAHLLLCSSHDFCSFLWMVPNMILFRTQLLETRSLSISRKRNWKAQIFTSKWRCTKGIKTETIKKVWSLQEELKRSEWNLELHNARPLFLLSKKTSSKHHLLGLSVSLTVLNSSPSTKSSLLRVQLASNPSWPSV